MAIIKSILHVFKKSDNAFKIMHPETESAQITDWHQGIVNTLASTALGGLVNTLTSDSLLAMMIQKVLTATGVKYNMAQNGYICFGALFGNLIIQWGTTDKVPANNGGKISFIYPIAVTLFANPILSGTSGSISTYDSVEGASIESASLAECIIIDDWNVYKKQQYRLIIIGK